MLNLSKISKVHLFLGALASLGILIICLFIADLIILPLYTKHGSEIELPDVVEKSSAEADSILNARGLRMIIDDHEYHPVLPESTVVFQKPAPYTKVKRGRRIYVNISDGEKHVTIPRVIGVSERDAKLKIQQAGLVVGEIKYRVSSYPNNVVCDQELPPNTEVPEKSEISFTVSLGRIKTDYTVPDVVGRQFSEAVSMIRREGLEIGTVQKEIRNDLIPDTVIRQSPEGGTKLNAPANVSLTVSELPVDQLPGE